MATFKSLYHALTWLSGATIALASLIQQEQHCSVQLEQLLEPMQLAASNNSATIPGLWADPHLAVFNNTYYIYPTKDGYPEDPESGKAYYAWKSPDLRRWERTKRPLLLYQNGTTPLNGTTPATGGDVTWAINDAWAPSMVEKDGTYYFYISGFNPAYNERSIGVATGPGPEGPFTPAQTPFITNIEPVFTNVAIDPHVFGPDPVSGKYYIFWGNGRPQFAEMEDDLLSHKVATTLQLCGLTNYVEAPFMVYRQGLYHLTYSVNVTTSPVYRVGYATSTQIAGPYEYQGVILRNDASQGILGTGHNAIVNAPGTDDWYIAYHRFAPGSNSTVLKREVMVDKLYFDADTGLIQEVIPTLTGV